MFVFLENCEFGKNLIKICKTVRNEELTMISFHYNIKSFDRVVKGFVLCDNGFQLNIRVHHNLYLVPSYLAETEKKC